MPRELKKGVELVGYRVYCPKLEKTINVPADACHMRGWSTQCEFMYDTGFQLEFSCKCGYDHKLTISST